MKIKATVWKGQFVKTALILNVRSGITSEYRVQYDIDYSKHFLWHVAVQFLWAIISWLRVSHKLKVHLYTTFIPYLNFISRFCFSKIASHDFPIRAVLKRHTVVLCEYLFSYCFAYFVSVIRIQTAGWNLKLIGIIFNMGNFFIHHSNDYSNIFCYVFNIMDS